MQLMLFYLSEKKLNRKKKKHRCGNRADFQRMAMSIYQGEQYLGVSYDEDLCVSKFRKYT